MFKKHCSILSFFQQSVDINGSSAASKARRLYCYSSVTVLICKLELGLDWRQAHVCWDLSCVSMKL